MSLCAKFIQKHPEWNTKAIKNCVGLAYDGRSIIYTSAVLVFPAGALNEKG